MNTTKTKSYNNKTRRATIVLVTIAVTVLRLLHATRAQVLNSSTRPALTATTFNKAMTFSWQSGHNATSRIAIEAEHEEQQVLDATTAQYDEKIQNEGQQKNQSHNQHQNNTNAINASRPEMETETEVEITFHQYCLEHRNSFADLATLILYAIVCIVGLFGNTLVIYVVLRFSKMQTVTNIYILNLAIADECFLIGIPFLLYTMRICSWKFGEYMCKAYMVSTSITQFTSSIFLLIMSADRFIAVCYPIVSPKYRTTRIAKAVSTIAWTTSAVLMLPVILFASTVSQEDGVNLSCNIKWPESYKTHSGTTFILYTFFLGFGTPLCFILFFYYLVIRKLRAVGRKHKSREKKRSHRKVTRLVLTVITVYILCWLPHWISQVALISSNPVQGDLTRLEILIFLLLGCLAYSNSAMNPILYAFLSDNFRKSFFKAFTCMNRHEVNAQLLAEPSVFTKQNSRRRGSRQPQCPMLKADNQCAPIGNNNSSTTTSSTTTAEKTALTVSLTPRVSNGCITANDGGTLLQPDTSVVECNVEEQKSVKLLQTEL